MSRDEAICTRAAQLIEQAHDGDHADQCDSLMQQAYHLLRPLVERDVPEAQYLHAYSTINLEVSDEGDRKKRRIELVKKAAEAGHARAQFTFGQMYESDADLPADPVRAAYWFEKSALQGYPYAQWVHGLNLLNGNGVRHDEALVLDFIRRAAEGRFEGAIQFVADAYSSGTHGFTRDLVEAELWRQRLLEPDVMPY
ncbi:MAG TPA: tetratricopeptide repeat protein [Dongiaceae bacterium]|jgi:hypothetical protein|nr:tetratricopeptide repeat protein [Dongiaceae bacterium]